MGKWREPDPALIQATLWGSSFIIVIRTFLGKVASERSDSGTHELSLLLLLMEIL